MSFTNDEEGDGLAALFGGVTPTAGAPGDAGPRRAAQAPPPAASAQPPPATAPPVEPPTSGWSPAAPSHFPGLVPSVPAAYGLPAPAAAPASPAYEMPAPAQQGPRSYDLPPPASAPSAPAWSPEPAPQHESPQPPPPYGSQQYQNPQVPPRYEAPQYEAPRYEAPRHEASQYESPHYQAPQYEPQQAPPRYDLPAPDSAQDFGTAPAGAAYPPTALYPARADIPAAFPSAPPQGAAFAPPVADPPSYAPPAAPGYEPPRSTPAPLEQPPPHVAPPLGYEAYARPPAPSEPQYDLQPVPSSPGEHPLVLSEPALPATVFPPGPLLPSSRAAVETPDDLERSTAIEKIGLVLALLTGPIGLVLAIGNAARSGRRRGWLIGIVRASLVLGVLSTIAAGIAGYLAWNVLQDQIAHDEVAAASAEFCEAAAADPTMVTAPTLGWPPQGASVGESITLMQAWTDRWVALAPGAPPKLQTGIELLAETGQSIVDGVTSSRTVDDATNQARIAAAAGESGVAGWHTTYCVAP